MTDICRAAPRLLKTEPAAVTGLEPHSETVREKIKGLAFMESELSPRGTGGVLHGHGKVFCIRSVRVSHPQVL